jgi:hypothetical protein
LFNDWGRNRLFDLWLWFSLDNRLFNDWGLGLGLDDLWLRLSFDDRLGFRHRFDHRGNRF